MKIVATFLIFLVVGSEYSLAARKSSSPNSKQTEEMLPAPKNSTSNTNQADKPPMAAEKDQLVAPGITVSKGFKKTNCLASRFAVLCASSSTVDGCVTKNSKTKCGKQCICGPKECDCGTSGCYCQVDGGCRCNGSKSS
ncbi:uncharacterized protein LOC119080103 isoform X2 [Bradysia coprophila]|uniref:uncharacterized protein LOC119080103 isoform X2 n=1 Tax=Bradysia coprophila TaxID=38358 RepID=UPI00187DCCBF|nr:uncharacterized protein LOC119080103 isoform X2 [Bradysia coprophila]